MSELLLCPFCGGEARILDQTLFDAVFFGAKCTICGAEAAAKSTEAEAIEAWNNRVKPPCGGNYCPLCGANRQTCYADDVTHRDCKYSVNRGWCERTCRNVHDWRDSNGVLHRDARIFKCSECGFKADDFYGDDEQSFPRYCPNCGAKVLP